MSLKSYDYNEPCHGKDQCDLESAGAKCVVKSYVDAGNDLMTAENLYHALHFAKGIQDAQVAVVTINQKETVLNGTSAIRYTKDKSVSSV